MDTVESAVEVLRLKKTPYWWVFNGSNKIGEHIESDDLNESIAHFRQVMEYQPGGSFSLKYSSNPKNHNGALHFSFKKAGNGSTAPATNGPMQAQGISTNPYGIPDTVLAEITRKAEQDFMFRQMHSDFTDFIKEWPKYREMIEKIDKFLKDDDDNGTPDFLETTKKVAETVQTANEVKKVFSGGSLFR